MRPSEALLSKFYDLADLDENKRYDAIVTITNALDVAADYCIERLINGLASSRAAARLGFSTALTHVLSILSEEWPATRLFMLADQKLDLSTAEDSSLALGQHLFHSAMINSERYSKAASEIVNRELSLIDKYAYFGMAACDSIAHLSLQLKEAKFAKRIWPLLKSRVVCPIESLRPEWLFFALSVFGSFADTMKEEVIFIDDNGKLSFSEEDWNGVVGILKKANGCSEYTLALKLLSAASDSSCFAYVYENIVESWLCSGDLLRAYMRSLEFMEIFLSTENHSPSEVLTVFSERFVKRLQSASSSREHRFYLRLIQSALTKLAERIDGIDWKTADLLKLLERFDAIRGGTFEVLLQKSRIIDKIMAKLDPEGIERVASKAVTDVGHSVKRIASMFPFWPAATKEAVLIKLARIENRVEEIHNTFCNCIGSLLSVNIRAGRNVKAVLSEESENILKNVYAKCVKDAKLPETENRPLLILFIVLKLWALTAPDDEERAEYVSDAEEASSISKIIDKEATKDDLSTLVDLLLSILSRPHRFHRSLVLFVFTSVLKNLNVDSVLHVLETISLPDDELMKESGEDVDGGDGEIHYDEMGDTKMPKKDDDDEMDIINEETDGSEVEETEENDDDLDEVDEEFAGKVKAALSSTTMPSEEESDDDHDKESVSSTVSDGTMFRLDEGIAAVFRQRLKASNKASASAVEQTQQFRSKCFDLLLITISHGDTKQFAAELLLPLFETARESLRRKGGELIFKKSTSLLEIILKYRKSEFGEEKAMQILGKLVRASSQTVNPVVRSIVGNISGFLFSSAYDPQKKMVSSKMRAKVDELFCRYMTQSDNQVLGELATAPFLKYPQALTKSLEKIIDFAFNTEIRVFRRTEAITCAVAFMRRDVVTENSDEDRKQWRKITAKLGGHLHTYFSTLIPDEVKPRFFAYTLRLLSAFGNNASSERKRQLFELLNEDLVAVCENKEFWKMTGKRKQHLNLTVQNICGRSTLSAIKHALASVKSQ